MAQRLRILHSRCQGHGRLILDSSLQAQRAGLVDALLHHTNSIKEKIMAEAKKFVVVAQCNDLSWRLPIAADGWPAREHIVDVEPEHWAPVRRAEAERRLALARSRSYTVRVETI